MDFSFKTIVGLFVIVWGLSIIFNFNIGRYLFPGFLIVVGIILLFNQQHFSGSDNKQETTTQNNIKYEAVFSSLNRKVTTDKFEGGKIDVVFAGGEIDLRDAKIPKGQTVDLEINAVFGGVKVLVPETWIVNNSVTGVFGAFENKTKMPTSGKEQGRLNLKGAAVFGGGEASN